MEIDNGAAMEGYFFMNRPLYENPNAPKEWKLWSEFQPALLQKNLSILEIRYPALAAEISSFADCGSYFLRVGSHGAIECAIWRNFQYELLLSGDHLLAEWSRIQSAMQSMSPPNQKNVIFYLGCDLGVTLSLILQHLSNAPQKAVAVVEPDIAWFALTLAAHSMEILLQSNRCFWAVGNDWLPTLETIFFENQFFTIAKPDTFFSAAARLGERIEYWNVLRAALGNWIRQGRDRYASEMEEARDYYQKKSSGDIRRMMALYLTEKDGKAIPYIHQRFLDECQRQGIDVVFHHPTFRSDVGFLRTVAREKPDLLLFINKSPGEFTDRDELDRLQLPRMIWCLDDPNCFMNDAFSLNDFVFTWDNSYRKNLESMQARSVDHFPYVADLDGVEACVEERFRSPVSFIGQVKAFTASEYGLDESTSELIEHVARLKARYPDRDYQQLILDHQDSFGLKIVRSESDAVPQYIRYGIYIAANALRRISLLECARPFGLKIYGNEDWLTLLKDHPLRDCYVGVADPRLDAPSIFVSSEINLNIHSLQALTSLNQRDFNCPLVGGFLLTDWVEGADEFFLPDEEMVFYHNAEELKRKIEYYLDHESERLEIVRRGRERVLREHTYASRAPRVLETLKTRIRERYER